MTAVTPGVALYVHVPFCVSKCVYCDFVSAADEGEPFRNGEAKSRSDVYLGALRARLRRVAGTGLLDDVPSVYIGGGTPTVLGERLPELLADVIAAIGLRPGAEVTVEANPESLTEALVADLLGAGATRFSLGVQSFDDETLRLLGRCHTAADADAAARLLAGSGAPFSVDLMCGVPGLDDATWRATAERAIATGAGHMSVYPLTVEEGTALAARVDAGLVPDTDPDAAAAQMTLAEELLRAADFERYEIASYARPGQEARHNVGYWTGVPYIGLGPSAASMLPSEEAARLQALNGAAAGLPAGSRVRFTLHDTYERFTCAPGDAEADAIEVLSAEEAVREDAMLGMRLSAGITGGLAERAGVVGALSRLRDQGLVENVASRWRLTERGWLLGNEVFERVWTAGADDSA